MSTAPDKATLTAFSKKAEAEIKQHQFAAKTGGLVSLSAPTFWELFYAAQAWHEHLAREQKFSGQLAGHIAEYRKQGAELRGTVDAMVRDGHLRDARHPPCAYCIGTGKNIMHGHPCGGDVKAIST